MNVHTYEWVTPVATSRLVFGTYAEQISSKLSLVILIFFEYFHKFICVFQNLP